LTTACLRLRPYIIAGESRPDDFNVVIEDGETAGRMYRVEVARTETWAWFGHFSGVPSGRTLSLDEAKKAFRAAWDARLE
jgi:hypothetical protein